MFCGEYKDLGNMGRCVLEGTLRSGKHIDSGNIRMDVLGENGDPGN